MKDWRVTGFVVILALGFLLMSGCTNTGSPGTTPRVPSTPQTFESPVLITASPTTLATPPAKYTVGDIVWRNDSNYDTELHRSRGMIIIRVNPQSYNYQYVSKNEGDTFWSQVYPNEEIENIVSFEESYPRKVDHGASIISQYPSRAAFDKALSDEICNSSYVCP